MSEGKGPDSELLKTPLDSVHRGLGARMVPFAGYEMPVQYSGLMEEHKAVRGVAGLFDVSHMGEFEIRGPGAASLVDRVSPSRISALEEGRVAYSCLTTEKGTFVDDILAYRLAPERFLLVVNASNRIKDLAWIESHAEDLDVVIEDQSLETGLIAVQGPRARALVSGLAEGFDGMAVKYYRIVEGKIAGCPVRASRTGYTGELGYEIFTSNGDAPKVWNALLDAGRADGVLPCGLGARDSLRLEAALPLYGNDIDETTSVLEAGLEFTIDWDKSDFIGKAALEAERERGATRHRVGFEIVGRGIARQGNPALVEGSPAGCVCSGTFSPTLEKAIGMAYLPSSVPAEGHDFEIDVRGRRLPARTVPMPFYKRPKKRPNKGPEGKKG